MTDQLDHLSYSSITMYMDCAESWRRKYIAKEKTKTTSALALGSAFHGTVERMVALGTVDISSIWREEFDKQFTDAVTLDADETREQHYNEGIRLLSHEAIRNQILSIQPRRDEAGNAAIEQRVELRVPGVPVPVIGYIDCILADNTPVDFKTSAKSWTDAQAGNSLQTLFYLAALNQMGQPVNWRFQHIVFVKTKTPQVQVLEHCHYAGELFFLFDVIKRVWDGISKDVYPLNPTTWRCNERYCDFYAQCKGKYIS